MTRTLSARIFPTRHDACFTLAGELARQIGDINASGHYAVLGLATGHTPLPFYAELIRRHREEGLSFRRVITFNLDEYLGLPPAHPESYRAFMQRELFQHIDILPANIHIPDGSLSADDIPAHCLAYEKAIHEAGGLDFQLLGIGRTGHIGFNEPGSPRDSRTRIVELNELTRRDAEMAFGSLAAVPEQAVSMGCGTILEARRIALLAWGEPKAAIIAEAIHGPVTERISASFLQEHPDATFYLDAAAAALL